MKGDAISPPQVRTTVKSGRMDGVKNPWEKNAGEINKGRLVKEKTVLKKPGLMKLAASFFVHAIAQIDLHPFLSIELLATFHHFH